MLVPVALVWRLPSRASPNCARHTRPRAQSHRDARQTQQDRVVRQSDVLRRSGGARGDGRGVQPPAQRDARLPGWQLAAAHDVDVPMARSLIVERDAVVVAARQGGADDEAPVDAQPPWPLQPKGAAHPIAHVKVLAAAHDTDQQQRGVVRRLCCRVPWLGVTGTLGEADRTAPLLGSDIGADRVHPATLQLREGRDMLYDVPAHVVPVLVRLHRRRHRRADVGANHGADVFSLLGADVAPVLGADHTDPLR